MSDFFHGFYVFLFCEELLGFLEALPGILVHRCRIENDRIAPLAAFCSPVSQIRFTAQVAAAMTVKLITKGTAYDNPPECLTWIKRQNGDLGVFHYTIDRGKKSLDRRINFMRIISGLATSRVLLLYRGSWPSSRHDPRSLCCQSGCRPETCVRSKQS